MPRLAEGVGDRLAAQIYTLCLDLLQRELPLLTDTFDLAICPSRNEDRDWVVSRFGCSNHVVPREAEDFGERLMEGLCFLRRLGYRDVVFLRSEAPSLPLPYLRVIRRILYEKDVVIGPAQEGGAYALGVRTDLPPMGGLPWDSERLFGELTDLFVRHDLSVGIGPPWYGVRSVDDLHRAAKDLSRSPSLARQMFGRWVRDVLACRGAEDGAVRDSH
ncbi:MAG: DUF2064 domain-containing protein [Candidatus Eisenbacteria bacterium]